MDYIKLFETHSEYETYINSENKKLPNLSYCEDADDVHFNPWVETKLVCKYNITDTTSATTLRTEYEQNIFKSMEIDGVLLDSLVTSYQFDTTGEHTVKYELYDETKVGNNAPLFNGITTLTSVLIPNSVTSIGEGAFSSCTGLTSIILSNSVTTIGDDAFNGCSSLTSITIPNSVTSIGYGAFFNCSGLTSITIPNSVTSIDANAFRNCTGLTSVTIGNGVTYIDENAFNGCTGLTSVTIGNSVSYIGVYAFSGCSGLTSIILPDSVIGIGGNVFYNCSSLTSITSLATIAPTIQSDTFQSIKTNGTLYVPTGSTGYDTWMSTGDDYLGKYNWTKVEQ